MSRPITIFGAQVRPVSFDVEATMARFEDQVMTGVQRFGADLLVFPELYLSAEDPFTGEEPPGYAGDVAQEIPGPLVEQVAKIAARARRWLFAGSILERAGDRIHNTALVFSPEGEMVSRYRKLMPWSPFEDTTPGDSLAVVELPGIGKAGVMTCYDGWFPEIARSLALQGAELIVQPSMTTTPDREEELVLARATAIVNQCFVVNINAATTIGGGRSIAVDPEGKVLFEAGVGEEYLVAAIDLDVVAAVRERGTRGLNRVWQHLQDAPPAVFGAYKRFDS